MYLGLVVTTGNAHLIRQPEDTAVLLKNRRDPHLRFFRWDPDLVLNLFSVRWDPLVLGETEGVEGASANTNLK
jgi:hypothetical protein